MTDGQSLFAVLVLLYLSDCLHWVSRDGVLFLPQGESYVCRLPGKLAGNLRGALMRLNPFPPFLPGFETHPLPFSVSEQGICAWVSSAIAPLGRRPQSGVAYAFSDIAEITCRDTDVWINGQCFVSLPTHEAATNGAKLIRTLQQVDPAARCAQLDDTMAARFDPERVRERVRRLHESLCWLAPLTHALFYILLFLAPLVCWHWGVSRMLIPVAIVLFACVVVVNLGYLRVHRELFPQETGARRLHAFIHCVSWPMAVRVATDMGRHALSDAHPIAVARVLLPDHDFRQLAGLIYRDACFPLPTDHLTKQQRGIVRAHRERIVRILRETIADIDAFTRPPILDPEETRYCPRCHTGYLPTAQTCIECYGIPLHSAQPDHGVSP